MFRKTVKVSGNRDIETGSQATKIAPQNDIIPAKDAFNMSQVYIMQVCLIYSILKALSDP